MSNLELKVIPLLQVVIVALLMWLTALFLPSLAIPPLLRLSLTTLFTVLGISFATLGVFAFRKHHTTVNPTKPQEASALVVSGVYKITRNPMYVGFLMLLIAWAVLQSSHYALSLTVVFILYMNRFQIQPEERFLAKKFPNEFENYKKAVRRWL